MAHSLSLGEDSELGLGLALRHVELAELPVVVERRSSELHSECVVELLHRDHTVCVVVESSHESMFFCVRDKDVQST